MDGTNPTVPLAFDLAWIAAILLWLGLVAIAWISILRSNQARRGSAFWWCLLGLIMPISGALIWFVARPRDSDTDQRTSS
ncbi:PLDc N-terminal domain-containing protein [Rhodococcus sp. IEGM 1354]|uniref:PLDc N-terminal domain-containing protein n=1 Tax=Rhodococcus sp. IEGM 1354 TaxID=3047088 RepID=UPI0024B7F788|nr:PLDc N-terminal domain-containing protein [Rhodococcus sp. IEGM 1354]MDI9928827.1 PLDc N-terminal domain-containing protein [Rhodococcus sp. IEGM 1354]